MRRQIAFTIVAVASIMLTAGCAEVTRHEFSAPPLCDNFRSTCNARSIVEFDLVRGTKSRMEIRSGSRVITSSSMVIGHASQARLQSIFESSAFQTMLQHPHSFFIIGVEPVLLACVPVEYSPKADEIMLTDQTALHYNASLAVWYVLSARFPACDEIVLVGPDQPAELVALNPTDSTIWTSAGVGGQIEFRRTGDYFVASPATMNE
jgi:hypothetical protein